MDHSSLSDRRIFLKKAVLGAGLAFAAPAILSSLGSGKLQAQASGPIGATPVGAATSCPYRNNGESV